MRYYLVLIAFLYLPVFVVAQDCSSAQIHTNESFLYGRFETAMRSVEGEAVVSSFFLYNLDVGCNWPEENNEIDLEMTGNKTRLVFTTHYPDLFYHTDTLDAGFNPHESIHDYAIEWEPGIVRWFVDGELVNVQDQDFVDGLIHPMRLMMNLYPAMGGGDDWAGFWDPSIMPLESEYEYVRVYDYTPGAGDYGTDNNFTLLWEDEFEAADTTLWEITNYDSFGGNHCLFMEASIEYNDGKLILQIEPAPEDPPLIPVTFSVNADTLLMEAGDVIYLNGTFNAWCGTCEVMTEDNGVWSKTIMLEPGTHEYVFAKNLWENIGQPEVGSECDYYPCDEYANYGFVLSEEDDELVTDTLCWDLCEPCAIPTSIFSNNASAQKAVVKVLNLLGQETAFIPGQLLIYCYSDGTIEKRIDIERPNILD